MHETREGWLQAAADLLRPMIDASGAAVPPVRLSMGFPKRGGSGHVLGDCWGGDIVADSIPTIHVSPYLSDPARVLDVLAHELIHAAVGPKCGHRGEFKRVAVNLGLEGKMTATVAGEALRARLNGLLSGLGPLPHAALIKRERGSVGSRLRLWECPCGIKLRVGRDDLDVTCNACGEAFKRQ